NHHAVGRTDRGDTAVADDDRASLDHPSGAVRSAHRDETRAAKGAYPIAAAPRNGERDLRDARPARVAHAILEERRRPPIEERLRVQPARIQRAAIADRRE